MVYNRREILFCHALLSFIETEFPGAKFKDDFPGRSRTELYFIHGGAFYLLEAKSEVETAETRHPGWKGTFQDVRDAICNLNLNNRFNKWLLYLAQLSDYTSPQKCSKTAKRFSEHYVILGLPHSKLSDCQSAIELVTTKLSINRPNYTSRINKKKGVAYLLMKEIDLLLFIQSLL